MISSKNKILTDNTSLECARKTLEKLEKGLAISAINSKELENIERVTDSIVLSEGLLVDAGALTSSKAATQLLEVGQGLILPVDINGSEREGLYDVANSYKDLLQRELKPVSSLPDYIELVKSGGYWDSKLDSRYPKKSDSSIDEQGYMWDRMCVRMGFMWALSKKLNTPMSPHHTRNEMILGLYNMGNKHQKIGIETPMAQARKILDESDEKIMSKLDTNKWTPSAYEFKKPSMFEWLWGKSNCSIKGFFEEAEGLANSSDVKSFRDFSIKLFHANRSGDRGKILEFSGQLDENLEQMLKGTKYKNGKISVTAVVPIPFIKMKLESERLSNFISSYTNSEFAFISKWVRR